MPGLHRGLAIKYYKVFGRKIMKFQSYAQNFEDVMLWRALSSVKQGFYIDVGAQDPVHDSVSKGFYEFGWRGVHIEPVPFYAELLRKDRPDEVVIEAIIDEVKGTRDFFSFNNSGLSTASLEYALRHQQEKGISFEINKVPCITLNDAILDIVLKKEIHWLKIDVEGLELNVLKGWNRKIIRPWIIVIEATIPNSRKVNYKTWENLLLEGDYEFVYFDGTNRFYLANEHNELRHYFAIPPNIRDVECGVQLSKESPWCGELNVTIHQEEEKRREIEKQVFQLETKRLENESLLEQEEEKVRELEIQICELKSELQKVLNSRSWKMTKLFRIVFHRIRLIRDKVFFNQFKAVIKVKIINYLLKIIKNINNKNNLKTLIVNISRKIGIEKKIRYYYLKFYALANRLNDRENTRDTLEIDIKLNALSPYALEIYDKLTSRNLKKDHI